MDIPDKIPAVVTAGDSWRWLVAVDDAAPADGWVLSYAFSNSAAQFKATSTDNGDGRFLVTVTAATTANIPAGSYRFQAYVTLGADRHTVARGELEVRPNLDAAADDNLIDARDSRTRWENILEDLEGALEQMARTPGVAVTVSHGTGDRSTTYSTKADLLAAISRARAEVARERRQAKLREGLPTGNRIRFRM